MIGQCWSQALAGIGGKTGEWQRKATRIACVLAVEMLVVACTTGDPIITSSPQASLAPESTFVQTPPGGAQIIGVVQHNYSNGTEQEVVLSTDASTSGQNLIRVRIFGPVDSKTAGKKSMSRKSIAMSNIGADIRSAVPGVAMRQSPFYVQNRYGPFGYAVGRAKSDLCIYGWQNLRAAGNIFENSGAIDIRLRYCQAGATEQQLLSLMYGYTITAFLNRGGWNPYGDVPPVASTLGVPGADVYPLSATRVETVLPPPAPLSPRPKLSRSPRAAEPMVQLPPTGPEVPPPPEVAQEIVVVPPPPSAAE